MKPLLAKPFGLLPPFLILLTAVFLSGCTFEKKTFKKGYAKSKSENVIEIITVGMDFQAPDSITSGWNAFRYINKSDETHFFLLNKYPQGKTILDNKKEIIPPFQNGMNFINQGKWELGIEEFNKLPKWFFEVKYCGGSGLVSPKSSCITTLKLDPGYYLMECYVKMPNGTFHTVMGMTKALIVTEKISKIQPPKTTINISVSSTEGITYPGKILKGNQTFSVYFKDQILHENFVGHDVNLVKLNEGSNLEELDAWMNWLNPKGLITPAPKGVVFLGGVNDMAEGNTGYFQAYLSPGDYAFISETPNPREKKMFKTFKVVE